MSKLNTGARLLRAPLQTEEKASGTTHEGGPGFARDPKAELFMRATAVFAGEGSFYETGRQADARIIELVRKLAVEDWDWTFDFLSWLRSEGNIRTSAIMLAAEAVHARLESHRILPGASDLRGEKTRRMLIEDVIQRADEVTEMIQYCLKTWGKIPMPVRRGCADAMLYKWRERGVLRWDKPERALRFADAIELVHPDPRKVRAPVGLTETHDRYRGWSPAEAAEDYERGHREHLSTLFRYLLDERHHGDGNPEGLSLISARRDLNQLRPGERHSIAAKALGNRGGWEDRKIERAAAGQWEWVKSWLGEGAGSLPTALSERERWELVIPWMGYMAVLRNLRNFDQAGIRPSLRDKIRQRLADPQEVASCRQFPFRFLVAHLNTRSVHWLETLETALQLSVPNVPLMPGRGLIMIDMSGSMEDPLSKPKRKDDDGEAVYPNRIQAAALFALVLAQRNAGRVDVYGFADPPGGRRDFWGWGQKIRANPGHFALGHIEPGFSVLRMMENVVSKIGYVGHGTAIEQNLRQCYDGHDWVTVFTDEQAIKGGPGWQSGYAHEIGDISACLPAETALFAWNLAGYGNGAFPTGANRYSLAGLTDASFGIMQRIMARKSGLWPWEA